jgi:hypothetical protein
MVVFLMATRADCIRAAMAGGLDKPAAQRVVEGLMAARVRVQAERAQGNVSNAEQALAQAWAQRMDDERIQNLIRRKQAAINFLRRNELDARIRGVLDEGFTGMDAIEALLVGSNKRFTGARDSIDAARVAIKRDMIGGFINALEAIDASGVVTKETTHEDSNLLREITSSGTAVAIRNAERQRNGYRAPVIKLMETPDFQASVVREVIRPGSTGDATAIVITAGLAPLFRAARRPQEMII